ncbi:MAG TPA: hypothetical protein VKT82_24430 [Ktedonobacterales bacterium]|nr:hypothetical protein [Ktedonobacterales bacterium]
MSYLVARRASRRVSLVLLALAVLAGATLAAWAVFQAAPTHHAAPTRVIDWQHPVKVPGPGMARSGIGSDATGDLFTPLRSGNAQATQPQAGFPSCFGDWAYTIWVNGTNTWITSRTTGMRAWVQYLWCPRWAGDQIGLNFAYGRAYVLTTLYGECNWVLLGYNPDIGQEVGASISGYDHGSTLHAQDGNDDNEVNVCPGHYAWDYSRTLPGDGFYSVLMAAWNESSIINGFAGAMATAWSPCCY